MIESGKLREDNAIALMAMQFCTTGAFAASMGAMLTMMTGDKSLASHQATVTTTTAPAQVTTAQAHATQPAPVVTAVTEVVSRDHEIQEELNASTCNGFYN